MASRARLCGSYSYRFLWLTGLMETLTSERSSLRRFAALALGGICDPGTAGALVEAIAASQRASGDDSESCVAAEAAVRALAGIVTKSLASMPPNILQRIAAMPASRAQRSRDVPDRIEAAQAVGHHRFVHQAAELPRQEHAAPEQIGARIDPGSSPHFNSPALLG